MNRDRWLTPEFAVLLAIVLFAMVQMARYVWHTLLALI